MRSLKMTSKRIQEAAKELLFRKKAAGSVLEYTTYTMPEYEAAPHHELICEALDKVANGEITRLIINMPPRHGKSELASIRFPAYYLSRFPDREVIFATSAQELAEEFGSKVLDIVQSPRHKNVFPEFDLKTTKPRRGDWKTNKNGAYFASGVGGPITGRGANLIIVDDAIKNMEDAESEAARKKLWDWYSTVLSTRQTTTRLPKGQGAAIVVIQTKWHEDDLSGKLYKEMMDGGEEWHILNLPALTVNGMIPREKQYENPKQLTALWPERYDVDALLLQRGKDSVRQRRFSCLYQQQPVPDEGIYFSRDWFNMYDPIQLPDNLVLYGTSDYALTEGRGDFTWHVIVGIDSDDNYWIIDGYRGQDNMLQWIDRQLDLLNVYRPVAWIGEAGQIRRASEPFIRKRMRERALYGRLDYINRTNKKTVEARSLQAVAAQQRIYIPNTEFGEELLEQIVRFPAARHDDAVDALANLFLAVDKLYGGTKKITGAKKPRDKWDRAFSSLDDEETNWKTI